MDHDNDLRDSQGDLIVLLDDPPDTQTRSAMLLRTASYQSGFCYYYWILLSSRISFQQALIAILGFILTSCFIYFLISHGNLLSHHLYLSTIIITFFVIALIMGLTKLYKQNKRQKEYTSFLDPENTELNARFRTDDND